MGESCFVGTCGGVAGRVRLWGESGERMRMEIIGFLIGRYISCCSTVSLSGKPVFLGKRRLLARLRLGRLAWSEAEHVGVYGFNIIAGQEQHQSSCRSRLERSSYTIARHISCFYSIARAQLQLKSPRALIHILHRLHSTLRFYQNGLPPTLSMLYHRRQARRRSPRRNQKDRRM
jgi:hypothetical protein